MSFRQALRHHLQHLVVGVGTTLSPVVLAQPAPPPEIPENPPTQAQSSASPHATAEPDAPAPEGSDEQLAVKQAAASPPDATPAETQGPDQEPAAAAKDAGAKDAEATDVEALMAELNTEQATDEFLAEQGAELDLFGFADFTYDQVLNGEDSSWRDVYQRGSFMVGNLNLYLDAKISQRWRSLAEVRFTYLPNGSLPSIDTRDTSTIGAASPNTTVSDPAENQNALRWGGIEIERAWLEYQHHSLLNIRMGQWLTPYGIWNVDHGTPTVIGVQRPYTIGQALFPERQTGIQLHGRFYMGATTLGYHATVSNGRGPIDEYRDLDSNFGVGGRLYAEYLGLGTLTLGISGYKGTYTDSQRSPGIDPDTGELTVTNQITEQYDDIALGADLKWEWQGLLLQGEAVVNDAVYEDDFRPQALSVVVGRPALVADSRTLGAYVLAGYRLDFMGIMPYALAETYNFANTVIFPHARWVSVGVNIRPEASIVLKAQYNHAVFDGQAPFVETDEALRMMRLQVAWAF